VSNLTPLVGGQFYHVYNRGNNGAKLFLEERNYAYFLQLYRRYLCPVADTYAYCLLGNHFHLLVRMKPLKDCASLEDGQSSVPRLIQDCASLKDGQSLYSQAFGNLFSTYTKAINKAHQRTGSLFEKNVKRLAIDSERHLIHLVGYIHRNPQKHGFVEDFRRYRYSSYAAIRYQKPSQVLGGEVLAWFGGVEAFERYHQQFDDGLIGHLLMEED